MVENQERRHGTTAKAILASNQPTFNSKTPWISYH